MCVLVLGYWNKIRKSFEKQNLGLSIAETAYSFSFHLLVSLYLTLSRNRCKQTEKNNFVKENVKRFWCSAKKKAK